MPLNNDPQILLVTTTAAESLPDPTTVAGRTHWIVNAFNANAVWSCASPALPFLLNSVAVATVTIPAASHISVLSDGVHWIVTDAPDNFILAAPTVTTPARTLNVTFTPSATRPVLGIYSCQITCSAALIAGQSGRVDLLADLGAPVTVRSSERNSLVPGLITALGDTTIQRTELTFLFPAGWSGQLKTTAETGAPTFSISAQTEIIL